MLNSLQFATAFLALCCVCVLLVFKAMFRSPVSCRIYSYCILSALILTLITVIGSMYSPSIGNYGAYQGRSHSEESNFEYGIMFDAGSTGSRIHVFKFNQSMSDVGHHVVEQIYLSVTPGLSAYAKQPQLVSFSLQPLLEKAMIYVPSNKWETTVVALKATAGLRLLSNNSAHIILNEVKKLFRSYPFKLSDKSISVLEGIDEGVFGWFTVNFLHGYLSNSSTTVGMMDLGGGSTQISFVPLPKITPQLKRHMVTVKYGKQSYRLYSRRLPD